MEYQWLKTFCIAAETLNFRKASEKLVMSQPSVTVHIRLLEEHLGTTLLTDKIIAYRCPMLVGSFFLKHSK